MPIEVRCPNPHCDRVHKVKNKYAGMRGRCPSCGTWMFIPTTGAMPSMTIPRPDYSEMVPEPAEAPAPAARTAPTRPEPLTLQEDEEAPRPKKARRSQEGLSAADFADPPRATARPRPEVDEDEAPAPPRKHFGVFALLVLFLGVLASASVMLVTTPFAEMVGITHPTVKVPPSAAEAEPKLKEKIGYKEEGAVYIQAVSGAAAGLGLLSFLIALVGRRFNFLTLFPAYLALLVAWFMLWESGFIFRRHVVQVEERNAKVQEVTQGQEHIQADWGQSFFVALGGAAGGFLLYSLAIFLMHRGLGGRLFFCLVWLLLAGLGGAVVFAKDLGLDVPVDIPLPW